MGLDQQQRFTSEDVEAWRRDGITLIPDFFTPDEVAAVRADFEAVFERTPAPTSR